MAEFLEVWRNHRRMCEAYEDCGKCPLWTICIRDIFDYDKLQEVERIVMSWAEEHPEPVYPTWEEWLLDNGVFAPDNILINGKSRFYMEGKPVFSIPTKKIYDRIPADIAQKLGIQPKEAT